MTSMFNVHCSVLRFLYCYGAPLLCLCVVGNKATKTVVG